MVDIGTFLQDQVIYSVHFLEDGRIVGCREEELIDINDPWTPSRFEFRDKVCPRMPLTLGGETLTPAGAVGEVLRVIRDAPGGVAYHLHFAEQLPGRVFQVAETLLDPAAGWIPAGEEEVEHDASLS